MDHVHNSADKKRITLNYLDQPIADDGKLLSEFCNFLGTTVRQFVSLTCASWRQVPEKELLWEYVKADVKKALEIEGIEVANKLIHDGKEYRPSYLIGRLIQKKEPKSKSSASPSVQVADQYVANLSAKIRAQLQQEMDEKLDQKVREMMRMLAEKNPDLNLKIDDSHKSVEESYGDDNVIP